MQNDETFLLPQMRNELRILDDLGNYSLQRVDSKFVD
jgi:hypothetical protein